ncbi:MAG TPA: LPS assembly lipoprotein LptE [Stenotrophobium sp.]|jgi:LPS-assembly lipoprotein|nr:LPS assembly lipoprotein LptE [Stenotrophobium sp.]
MKVLAAIGLTLILSACAGFHLAGSRPLPPALQSVYIDVIAPYEVSEPPVEVALRALIQRRGGTVLDHENGASAVIRLSNISETQQTMAVGPDGKALEYQLLTSVNYTVFNGKQLLVAPGVITSSRIFSFDPTHVLANDAEEAHLREYIQNDLADLLLLRFDAVLSRADQAPVTATAVPAGSPGAAPAP